MQKDTKGKPVSKDEGLSMHKKLKMGMPVETGAGKGAMGGKNPPKTKP